MRSILSLLISSSVLAVPFVFAETSFAVPTTFRATATQGESVVISVPESGACAKRAPKHGASEGLFWVPDGPPRAFRDKSNQVHFIVPHMITYPLVGPNLSQLTSRCDRPAQESEQHPDSNGFNDYTWLWSPYRLPDGRVVSINHHEFHAWTHGQGGSSSDSWYPAVTLSTSNDGWSFPSRVAHPQDHRIALPPAPMVPGTNGGGYSDPSNVMRNPVDGLYYMVMMYKKPGSHAPYGCVARSNNLLDSGSWRVYDGTGYNIDPRTGAECPNFAISYGDGHAPGSLTWSVTQNTAVYLTFGVRAGKPGFYGFIAQNSSLTRFSDARLVLSAPLTWVADRGMRVAYPSLLDESVTTDNLSFDRIGDTPSLYYVRFNGSSSRDVVRVPLQLQWNTTEVENMAKMCYLDQNDDTKVYFSNGAGRSCRTCPGQIQDTCLVSWDERTRMISRASNNHGANIDDGQCASCNQSQRMPLFRLYARLRGEHMVSLSATEAPRLFVNEGTLGYSYRDAAIPDLHPIYRCLVRLSGYHFVSTDPGCEGQKSEGSLGWLGNNPGPDRVAMHRCVRGPDHLITTDARECQNARYTYEGTLGYLFTGP